MTHIVKLDIENVMRVNAVHIEPDGNVVILGGKNAQGKTSVLDSISMAIGGARLCPSVPIKDGQEEAEIALTLGDLSVTRKFKRDGDGYRSALTVKNAKGEPVAQPQKTLDALVGKLAFDPLEFARMAPARARETLRELVGLDVEQLEESLGNVYRKRTEAWREKRDAQAVVDDMPIPGEIPNKMSTDAITETMARANVKLAEHEERKGIEARAKYNYETACANVERLQNELADAEAEVTRTLDRHAQAYSAIQGFETPDFDAIKQQLDSAMRFNQDADAIRRAREQYDGKAEEANEAAEAWKKLDTEHNQIDNEIKKRTEAVVYPIEGLELRPEGVYYQGVPFEQGSRAEKIKVSMAMGMAMNEKLRVLLIRDGSVLDKKSMETLAALAAKHNFQFWIEMARGYENAEGAIVIDDGGVVV